MTAHKDGTAVEIECDTPGCVSAYHGVGSSFAHAFGEVYDEAKERGWRAFQKDGRWQHACPGCMAKRAARMREGRGER